MVMHIVKVALAWLRIAKFKDLNVHDFVFQLTKCHSCYRYFEMPECNWTYTLAKSMYVVQVMDKGIRKLHMVITPDAKKSIEYTLKTIAGHLGFNLNIHIDMYCLQSNLLKLLKHIKVISILFCRKWWHIGLVSRESDANNCKYKSRTLWSSTTLWDTPSSQASKEAEYS